MIMKQDLNADFSQREVMEFLLDPATHGCAEGGITRVQTHLSEIVLAGHLVYKLKRAVQLPYVDFSTYKSRLSACLHELEFNRKTAPMIYRAVRKITRGKDGRLSFDGEGEEIDAVVEMTRFDEDAVLENMAKRHILANSTLEAVAREVARFHDSADMAAGNGDMSAVLDVNFAAFKSSNFFAEDLVARFDAGCRRLHAAHLGLLSRRAQDGYCRRCHGDLHLRNICLIDSKPMLFDCIEFNADLSAIDVLYDLAFLLMDLWRLEQRAQANLVLNRYLDTRDDEDGLPLIPFFMALRAGIRAHVLATYATDCAMPDHEKIANDAHQYMALALRLLESSRARVLVISGKSGTGKSTIAAAIADRVGSPPGARILSSDRIRKQIFGAPVQAKLPAAAYSLAISEKVYAYQAAHAQAIATNGTGVIVDAVFDRLADRQRIEKAAQAANASFFAVQLVAPVATLLYRVATREPGPSDADASIVAVQHAKADGHNAWKKIDASGSQEQTVTHLAKIIEEDINAQTDP
jgi:uncharacterized protein